MAVIRIRVEGARESEREIRAQVDKLADIKGLLSHLGEELLDSTRRRFVDMVAPDGARWAPLNEDYRRRKKKNADKILTLTGDLRNLMRYQVTGNVLEVGSDRVYSSTHQYGRGAIPARPFLGISKEDERSILDIVREHLE